MKNVSYDLRCNEVEEWLIKKKFSSTVVRKQILKARVLSRYALLGKTKEVRNNDRLVLTLTYHPSFKNFQNRLNKAHILLALNTVIFLVINLFWLAGENPKGDKYKRAPCCRSRFKFVVLLRKLKLFKTRIKVKHLNIRKGILNCRTNLVVYLIQCRSCSKQYVGSTITAFCKCFNNYKSGARIVSKVYHKKCNFYQKQFHRHFNSEGHNDMEDWKIIIIDKAENVSEFRRRESYW